MRAISPNLGTEEITLAEDQLEYSPLVVAPVLSPEGHQMVVSRWRLDEAEKEMIANGEDIFLTILTFGHPPPPVGLRVGPPEVHFIRLQEDTEPQ